jgi:23S rRNA pseudouridine2605 synthase
VPEIRLQKALADAGIASRRHAEAMIAAGRVTVDGMVATTGLKVDPSTQAIAVDGLPLGAPARTTCIALHKPPGVTSTVSDPHAASTVLDLVPREMLEDAGRLYPVGRLDRDSEGLLLLTNDGDWAQRVLHPRHQVEREYAVGLTRPLAAAQVEALLGGIDLQEGRTALLGLRAQTPTETGALLQLLGPRAPAGLAWYRATLGQGWKRQIRRMFGAVGAPVARLVRVRIGTLRLGGLRPGQVRRLTRAEVALLGETGPARPGTR